MVDKNTNFSLVRARKKIRPAPDCTYEGNAIEPLSAEIDVRQLEELVRLK